MRPSGFLNYLPDTIWTAEILTNLITSDLKINLKIFITKLVLQ